MRGMIQEASLQENSAPEGILATRLKRKGSALIHDLNPELQRYIIDRVNMAIGGTGSIYRMHKLLGYGLKEARALYGAHAGTKTYTTGTKRQFILTKLDLMRMIELIVMKQVDGIDTGHPNFSIDWDKYTGKGKVVAKPIPKGKIAGRFSKKKSKSRPGVYRRVTNKFEPKQVQRESIVIPKEYRNNAILEPIHSEILIEVPED